MAEQVLDPETMSMDELRKLAEAEALAQSTKTPEQIAAEEEAARVATAATKTAEEQAAEEEAARVEAAKTGPFYAERSIDLGDGAGIQVFKGKGTTREEALENLSDELAKAQTNATRKIRELSKAKPVEKVVSSDDEALYSAELLKTPTIAFKKLFKEVTGVDVEEFKTVTAREKAFQAAQQKRTIADQFTAAHPDYLDNDRNGKLINKWLTLHNDFSLDGFNKAYTDLAESGLLQVKDAEAGGEQKTAEAEAKRIADAAEAASSQRTKKSSGLSTHRGTTVTAPATPSEEDMYALPLDELRKRANQQLATSR